MKHFLGLLFIVIFFQSCRAPEKHAGFCAISDYDIYVDEVKSESIPEGYIEFLDRSLLKLNHKESMRNIYILHCDSASVYVYNENPKTNLNVIRQFIKLFKTDSTRLSEFVNFNDSIRITASRFCKDKQNQYNFQRYVDWKVVYFKFVNNKYEAQNQTVLLNNCNWEK
jgi:hypothetical protein